MDPPDLRPPDAIDDVPGTFDQALPDGSIAFSGDEAGMGWLDEIVARLEEDPDECWPAIEGLSELDAAFRIRVIAALADYGERPGVRGLLRLLDSALDPAISPAPTEAMPLHDRDPGEFRQEGAGEPAVPLAPVIPSPARLPAILYAPDDSGLVLVADPPSTQLVRSLVSALDGEGRGTIVLSASASGYRRTAAFRCDIRRGLLDAIGEIEAEHPSAGGLIDQCIQEADAHSVVDTPELAARLLQGCFLLNGPEVPDHVQAWLDATIGPIRRPVGLAAALPEGERDAISDHEIADCAGRILDACPTWLDRSALTIELAEEIALREGCAGPDPVRDAGAYRYLFEHLLIGRLELYSRMLLWMAWLWNAGGRPDLSRSAFALAAQLSDEQYVVPSHPFTVALTTRSLLAAQGALLECEDSNAEG